MNRMVALLLILLLAACGEETAPEEAASRPGTPSGRATAVTSGRAQDGQLDGLTLTLELEKTVVTSGDAIPARLVVENDTDAAITDPACLLGAPRFGIVPADDPTAELEHVVIVDCGGPHTYESGAREEYSGHSFRAATIDGKPLPPGEYVAAMELEGVSERIEVPVTVASDG